MGTKIWCGAAMLASLAAGVGVAGAADLAVKAPVYKAPPPVILSDWAGFYLGVNGGYGWANAPLTDMAGFQHASKPSGGLVGGHAGYNWQFGSVVVGVEGDFDGAFLKGNDVTNTFTTKTDELASARFRGGYTILPSLLAYGTAGAGWGHSTLTPVGGGVTDGMSQFGWTAGGGLEYKFWGNFIARAEYLHYGFGKDTFPGYQVPVNEDINVVRGGVSYKF